jgi:hypothetical protein
MALLGLSQHPGDVSADFGRMAGAQERLMDHGREGRVLEEDQHVHDCEPDNIDDGLESAWERTSVDLM